MKKIKLFLCVALFGAMSFGAFSAYDHLTMNDAERALLENIEALTQLENEDILIQGYGTRYVLLERYGSYTFFADCCMPTTNTDYCNYGVVKCKNGKLD